MLLKNLLRLPIYDNDKKFFVSLQSVNIFKKTKLKMKKLVVFGGMAVLMLTMAACGGKTESNPEADSLRTELSAQMEAMDEMNLFLDAVNVSMDSVIGMEGSVLRTSGESPLSRKDQIKQNIETYKTILKQQRDRLDILEKKLKNSNAYAGKMQKTIAALKQQLDDKDKTIAQLTEELEQRNYDIEVLKENVDKLNTHVSELVEDSKAKDEEINRQDNKMNEAYVFIGTKEALKDAGLAQGGTLFKKLKVNASNIDNRVFRKIDIRNEKSFAIPDDDPEVLSQMPTGSYKITVKADDTSVLTITDTDRFWSVSRYLIVRY